jgi:hypothetical protein
MLRDRKMLKQVDMFGIMGFDFWLEEASRQLSNVLL